VRPIDNKREFVQPKAIQLEVEARQKPLEFIPRLIVKVVQKQVALTLIKPRPIKVKTIPIANVEIAERFNNEVLPAPQIAPPNIAEKVVPLFLQPVEKPLKVSKVKKNSIPTPLKLVPKLNKITEKTVQQPEELEIIDEIKRVVPPLNELNPVIKPNIVTVKPHIKSASEAPEGIVQLPVATLLPRPSEVVEDLIESFIRDHEVITVASEFPESYEQAEGIAEVPIQTVDILEYTAELPQTETELTGQPLETEVTPKQIVVATEEIILPVEQEQIIEFACLFMPVEEFKITEEITEILNSTEIEPLPPVCIEVTTKILELAPEPAELAKEMLNEIVQVIDRVIEMRINGSDEAIVSEEKLEQLCIMLFEYLGIVYTPEAVMEFVTGIIRTRQLLPIEAMQRAQNNDTDEGTHELKMGRLFQMFHYPSTRRLGTLILQLTQYAA
jgi:hypothetical protein